jgi:hypothetical protein
MTLVAIDILQLVITIDMAGLAGRGNMSPRQREQRGTMIERRWSPHARTMALRAVVTEVRCNMIGIRRLLELCLMALITIDILQLVVAVDMT